MQEKLSTSAQRRAGSDANGHTDHSTTDHSAVDHEAWLQPIPESARTAEVLVALGPVTADTIAQFPSLVLIQTASDGYETVDIDAATRAGIYVSFAPGGPSGNADSVAEFTVFLLLAAARNASEALRSIQDPHTPKPMHNLALLGTTVCIVGLGDIGLRIADRLRPFGVHLAAVDPHPHNPPADIRVTPDLRPSFGYVQDIAGVRPITSDLVVEEVRGDHGFPATATIRCPPVGLAVRVDTLAFAPLRFVDGDRVDHFPRAHARFVTADGGTTWAPLTR